MIVPKGESLTLNKTFGPGEDVPDTLLNEGTKRKWTSLSGKNTPKNSEGIKKPDTQKAGK